MYEELIHFLVIESLLMLVTRTVSFSIPSETESTLSVTCPASGAMSFNECSLTRISKTNCNGRNVTYFICSGTLPCINIIIVHNVHHAEYKYLTLILFLLIIANCESTGQIRLVGGTSELNGRIQICSFTRLWGGICDSGWDNRDALVACRQLGLLMNNEGILHVTNVLCSILYNTNVV